MPATVNNDCDANIDEGCPTCGNDLVEPGEECDDLSADCVGCQVAPTSVDGSGDFEGGFSQGSFDRYLIRLERPSDVGLRIRPLVGGCAAALNLRLRIFVYAIDDAGSRLVASSNNPLNCPELTLTNLLPGRYEVRVDHGFGEVPANHFLSINILEPLIEGPDEFFCGDGELHPDRDEQCDHPRPQCVNCRVLPVDAQGGGVFPSGFQANGFDRFVFSLSGATDTNIFIDGAR